MTSGNRISKKLYLRILFGSIVVSFAPALLMRSGRDEVSTWVLMAAGTAVLTVAMPIVIVSTWLPVVGILASLAVVVLYAPVIIRVCDGVNALESSAE